MWVLYNEDIFNDAISVTLVVRLSALACNDSPSKNTMRLSDFPLPIWISGIGDSTSFVNDPLNFLRHHWSKLACTKLAQTRRFLTARSDAEEVDFKSSLFENSTSSIESVPPPKKTCQPITSPHFSIIRPNSNPYPLTKNLTFFSFSTTSFFFFHLIECKISSLFITGLTASTFFLNKTLNITPLNLRNAFQNLSVSSPKVRFI